MPEPSACAGPAHTAPYARPYATVRRAPARTWRVRRLFLALGVVAAPVLAQEAGYAPPRPGSVLEYAGHPFGVDCTTWTLTEVAADGTATAECAGHRLTLDANGNPIAVVAPDGRKLIEFKPAAPGLRFPLAVGARWRQGYTAFTAFNGLVWDGEASCRVEAFEPVQVAAGSFDAFRIECQDKWMVGPKSGFTHLTRWYAPAVATVVRQLHREDPARWNFELVRSAETAPAVPAASPPAPSTSPAAAPAPGPRPQYDPSVPDILDPDEY